MQRSLKSPGEWRTALLLYQKYGWTYSQIARRYGCSYRTVSGHLHALGVKRRRSPAWHSIQGRRIYETWRSMRQWCTNPNCQNFRHHGGQGIGISPEWGRFPAFHAWAIGSGYRVGRCIDRIDRTRDFSPENCRWIGAREKRKRSRELTPIRATTARIRAFGKVKTASQWAEDPRCVVTSLSLRRRLLRGVAPEAAILTPPRSRWDRPLPTVKKPAISKRATPKVDWERVSRLYRERGMSPGDIAESLGVAYSTIQAGLRQRFGPLAAHRIMTPDRERIHGLWDSLLSRTTKARHPLYSANGAIGVRVCREWQDFESFFRWALRSGSKPELCLARIRRRGPYSPENCEWLTRSQMSARRARAKGLGARRAPGH